MPAGKGAPTTEEKAENLVLNYSLIMMGVFEGVFAALASKMSEAMVAGAEATGEALSQGTGGTSTEGARARAPETEAQVTKGVKEMFSKIRSEAAAQMSAGGEALHEYLKNPRFKEGISIVEEYDFGLPKLTEPLGDGDIASYLTLLGKEDAKMVEMFRELSEWQKTMPKLTNGEI